MINSKVIDFKIIIICQYLNCKFSLIILATVYSYIDFFDINLHSVSTPTMAQRLHNLICEISVERSYRVYNMQPK